jgi:hypothetical protein
MSDIIDFIGHCVEGMAVWRYLFSSSYRRRTHVRWGSQSRLETGLEIFFYCISFIFVTVILFALIWWLS